jgi:ABC-type sugar transport system substrate-binding protein
MWERIRPGLAAAMAAAVLLPGAGMAAGKIGISLPTVQGPFFTAEIYGMTEEAKARGYEVIILDAGGYGRPDQQVSDMQNLLAQQVSAILVDPADDTSFVGVLAEAKEAGVPVIAAGAPLTGADGSVSASHCDLGKAMAEGAKVLLPDGGTMAALTGPAGGFWATERWRCFKEALAGGNIEIVSEQTSEPDAAVGLGIATDILQRFPDVDLLYGADDTVGVGAARAVQAEGECGKVKVLTAILGETTEELMRGGCVDYVVAQQVVAIGRGSIAMADELIKGQAPAVKDVVVETVAVTPANLDSVDLGSIRQPKGWSVP